MSIFKISGTHVKPTFFKTLYFNVSKKSVPSNFLKSIFFMGAASGFNPIIFCNDFAIKTGKFHFSPENRARAAKLSVPINSAEKNTSKCVLWICGEIFLAKL